MLFFAPFWISYMLRMLAWISLLEDDGLLNSVLIGSGSCRRPYPWLAGKPVTLIIGLVYGYVPFMVLPLFATLDRIHPSHARGGPRPRREPGADVLARHVPAVASRGSSPGS